MSRRRVLLVQLPIPPLGPGPIRGNVPLAAAYLKVFAEGLGLAHDYDIELFPSAAANALGDRALAAALAERRPWLVGFTCYLWNVERTLWVARELRRLRPGVRVVIGGPEVTTDNAWLLETTEYDYSVLGEGEQTFANLLLALANDDAPPVPIAGLYVAPSSTPRFRPDRLPGSRKPLSDLSRLGSPYLAGVLDAADERLVLLETTRGCVFRCKFCYYPKAYPDQYFLPAETVRAVLRHASERGAEEVVLLDPTLNQRRDFEDFLRLLIAGNPGQRFSYFGELRGEGITPRTAALLREASFTEVEVGLQSVEPEAMTRMDRLNNLRAFERGVRAMLAEGIRVKVDLIVGLPGDTPESVRRGLGYLRENGFAGDVQVFNLAVLPGTAFRHEAAELGLAFQPRPPYYVLQTPTLSRTDLFGLMQEAQQSLGVEFDPAPRPVLDLDASAEPVPLWRVDLDGPPTPAPPPENRSQAFTLWLRSARFAEHERRIAALSREVLAANPFTTLQVVLDPCSSLPPSAIARDLPARLLSSLLSACQESPTYLDRFYALQPGRPVGAKRLVVLLPLSLRTRLPDEWLDEVGALATLVWQTERPGDDVEATMEADEYTWVAATPVR
jgi:radical SAM superfamily enzyme YgiQ (UPF0313 family)